MHDETAVLNHYNLTNAYPTAWPTEKDDSDGSGDEKDLGLSRNYVRRSRSRYSALERSERERRSHVPGSEKMPHGQENLVQKDEPDPLGGTDSVVRVLKQKGLPVEEDIRLRNRFLLSSTTFSPNMFLSQVHADASNKELIQGLESLSRSIDSKSASLKVLVESNFERFVRAKTTIDNVYAEMRNQGTEVEQERKKGHSRIASREHRHFRNTSNQSLMDRETRSTVSEKKKNALVKESEYGVLGVKSPLTEAAVKVEEVWGPALGGRAREESLKTIMNSFENGHDIFAIDRGIADCMKRKDYHTLVQQYTNARQRRESARLLADRAYRDKRQLTDSEVNQIVLTGRMWANVEKNVADLKREVWRRLAGTPIGSQANRGKSENEEYMPLISVLLELGVEDNPIWVWLLSRYDYLKNKINATFERSRVEIEVLRRRLANNGAPPVQLYARHLNVRGNEDLESIKNKIDTPPVLELWDLIYESLNHLLSLKHGILGEITDFWGKAQSFIDGKAQKILPLGVDGQSRHHHQLSPDGIVDLHNGVVELIGMLQGYISSFFSDPPIDDVSMLYSPHPATPTTPRSAMSPTMSPYAHQDSRFRFDDKNPAPSSPKRGEAWEDFAFWPPYANSLGGVYYLAKILTLLGSSASEMMTVRPVTATQTLPEKLKATIGAARERCLRVTSIAWSKDAEACKYLEDWCRKSEHSDLTNMPATFSAFENKVLSGMQKILYIPEATSSKPGVPSMVLPPAAKLVQMVRGQFVTSLYKALSGMVENAERTKTSTSNSTASATLEGSVVAKESDMSVGTSDRSVRHLLTLSNLKLIQTQTIPELISQFEVNFSILLSDENKQLRDALTQISDRLFLSYTRSTAARLTELVQAGITAPDWVPDTSRPTEVRPYVYEALLVLVNTHTEVSTTTPGPLTNQVLSHLLEQLSEAFLAAFQRRAVYPLPALMQATLDMEFVAQTMSQYTTKRASEIQSQIYVVLDEKTTSDASKSLQGELPEMRIVLKRLREGTRTEFLAFRRERGRAVSRSD